MASYNHNDIEKKWQKKWEDEKLYATNTKSDKKKWFGLVEFPYPSGAGLHVGHVRSYTGMDIIARKRRMGGNEVLFPIGWDAFGLPAENYAIKTGIHPSITTRENIDTFRRQLKACGFSFDWDREVDTTDPQYYKWTQWIFLQLYSKGLAYKKEMPVNWCPKDKCVLANEEVLDGACERCGTAVQKKNKEQWMLGITKYAERLDNDLDDTIFLDKIKIQQRNWIGMSEGSEIDFRLKTTDKKFESTFTIFTTRADTLFGCTYCVFAPEHALVEDLLKNGNIKNNDEVRVYKENARLKTDIDRSAEGKEKTGVKLEGVVAVNPANNEEVPVFIADYVLPGYGTGAIMAVPAHDERDFEFAKAYNISVKEVISPETGIPQENPEFRKSIVAVVWNKKNNTFLSINWGKTMGGNLFVGGGVEGDEDIIECAKREVEEETGYKNVSFLAKTIPIHHSYFAHSKNIARRIEATGVLFELLDDEKGEVSLEENEKNKFTTMWLSEKDVLTLVVDQLHSFVFKNVVKHELYADDGTLINSDFFNGLTSAAARIKITEAVGGRIVKKSKMRDWVFARQRYWGEPIPLVYDKDGTMYPVHESNLPITLPQVDKYEPTDNGESPLYQVPEWVHVKGYVDEDGFFHADTTKEEVFRRETDTMPQWAGSSWYFMRYIDPKNNDALGEKEMISKWLPVDWYNGGMEHTTLHLLYSRFWYKFLFDIGLVKTSEPYYKRTSQGMILGDGGVKMSKSLGNVVNPDDIIKEYGADTLRLYEMFIGPFDQAVVWNSKAVSGVRRFLDKVYSFKERVVDSTTTIHATHQLIKKVTEDIETMSFNTCISQMMIWSNTIEKEESLSKKDLSLFLQMLAPFAPHIAEELWQEIGRKESVHSTPWPEFDPSMLTTSEVTMAFQVSGKLRGTIEVSRDMTDEEVMDIVKKHEMYQKYIGNQGFKKVIIVKNKIVNIVI